MDILKLDPMVRKISVHTEAFQTAIVDGNTAAARVHLTEIRKFADYLDDDLTAAIQKGEEIEDISGVSQFAGGVPLIKWNETGKQFDVTQRDDVLPGFVMPARSHAQIRKAAGTFGRYVNGD